jgi:drug/metabolite transporter (DMT)-like permease
MTAETTHLGSDNIRGIIAMITAMAAFVVNDTLLKIAAASLPTGEVIFIRGLFTTALCGGLILQSGIGWALPHALSPRVLGRAVADTGAAIFFLLALMHMPFGDAYAILQFTPLGITAAAALFLGAHVGWRRWSAAALGLVGVLIIVRPAGATFNAYGLLALTSTFFSIARDLLTRGVALSVPSLVIAGASTCAITLTSLAFTLVETWSAPSLRTLGLLVAASGALLAGQHWLIAAMRTGEIAVVAPFRYSIILMALLSGFLVWGELPNLATWIGIAIVCAAGLYTFLREQRLARAARS